MPRDALRDEKIPMSLAPSQSHEKAHESGSGGEDISSCDSTQSGRESRASSAPTTTCLADSEERKRVHVKVQKLRSRAQRQPSIFSVLQLACHACNRAHAACDDSRPCKVRRATSCELARRARRMSTQAPFARHAELPSTRDRVH